MSAIPVKSILQTVAKNIAKKFPLSRTAERSVQQRQRKGHTLRFVQQSGQSGRSPNPLSYEQLGRCADFMKQTWNLFAKKAWDRHKIKNKVKGSFVQACEKLFRPPNKTTQEKVVASRSDCEHEHREISEDSGASLHMMSSHGEKDTIMKSKGPTVISTDSGKAKLMEEATVYVTDLDVFVTMKLLEDSPEVPSLGFLCEEMCDFHEWKRDRSPSLIKKRQHKVQV